MPPIDKHAKISFQRTGKEYLGLHEWMDKYPEKKVERHDIKRMIEFGKMMEAEYGPEGLQEYIEHIHDDFLARFSHVKEELDQAIDSTLDYFSVNRPKNRVPDNGGIRTSSVRLKGSNDNYREG